MKTIAKNISLLIFPILFFSNCKKEEAFLNAKPNQSLIVPSNLDDYEKLLNNDNLFNRSADPQLGTITSDEYSLTDEAFINLPSNTARNTYIWKTDVYESDSDGDPVWDVPYRQIYFSNTILEGIDRLTILTNQTEQYNRIKGSALFFRAWAFYNLIQTYAMPYDSITSKADLGIPLRLNTNLTEKSVRATVRDCYNQIINDVTLSITLLPSQNNIKTLPSGLAAKGFLARIYLAISDFEKANEWANSYLVQDNQLNDYNLLSPTTSTISSSFLAEDKFHTFVNSLITRSSAIVNPTLVTSYANGDLRKDYLFRLSGGNYLFKGYYDYNGNQYTGIATDEIYLIRAECLARANNIVAAMSDLNNLLSKRWKTGFMFTPLQAVNADDALLKILAERRKELLFRGLRWTDLRRLNKDDRFKVTLTRTINGNTYTLPPNDPRYALPIPKSEIELSGIPQNVR